MLLEDEQKVVLTPSFAPHKVVLLALVAAYCAGILPKKTHRPLLTTIVKYIEGPSLHDNDVTQVTIPTLDEMFRTIKEACLKSDQREGGAFADDIELRILHALWSLHTLDSLHSFITRAKSLLVENLGQGRKLIESMPADSIPKYLLTKSSFLGNFVLNSIIGFESLEFDKTTLLWQSFVNFRESSESLWKEKGKAKESSPHDLFGSTKKDDDPSVIQSLLQTVNLTKTDESNVLLLSQEDLSRLIDYQVHILETYGTPTFPGFRKVLMKMTQSDTGKLPSIHYINYLECTRDADYEGAFESLHRYFDYMMSNRQTVFYHYALLSLATLHASFHCDGEAIRAIEESISVARENKDTACLNFLLTWVFNFLKDRPHLKHKFYVSNDQLLQFLKSRTVESSSTLHSIAYQSDVTQLLLEGDSLVSIIESLTKSLHISLSGGTLLTAFISYCALSTSFWSRTGNYHLADIYNSVQLQTSTSVLQTFSSTIRRAHLEFSKGNIEEAFNLIDIQKELIKGDNRLVSELKTHETLLISEQNIRSSNYSSARINLDLLQGQDISNNDVEGQLYYLLVLLNLKLGNSEKAFDITTERLSNFANKSSNRFWFIRFSILMCQIISESSSPARVLSSSIQSFKLAVSSGYVVLALESLLVLVSILIRLRQFDDAYSLISEYLPKFKQASDIELSSKAYKYLAKVLIAKAVGSEDTEQPRIDLITKIIQSLEIAVDGFKKISNFEEIKECLNLQLEIGSSIQHQDIIDHANHTLQKVNEKLVLNSF